MSRLRLTLFAFAFSLSFLCVGLTNLEARTPASPKNRSRKLLNDDSLSVQPSAQAGTTSLTQVTSENSGTSLSTPSATVPLETKTTGVQTPSGLVGKVLPLSPVTAATQYIPVPAKDSSSQTMMIQQLMQGLSGMGLGGSGNNSGRGNGSGSASASGARSGSNSGTESRTSSPNSGSNPSSSRLNSDSSRSDQVGTAAPLPADVQVTGRNCSNSTTTWQPPTAKSFHTTSCFGFRRSTGTTHQGVDMILSDQTILPVAPGKIIEAKWRGAYGCQIIIEHDSCPSAIGGTKCYSQYAHLKCESGYGPSCTCPASGNVGQKVSPCAKLGKMGQTGGNSTGNHLHLEVRTSSHDNQKDPVQNFKEWQAHVNYNAKASTCGTVGNGKAPNRLPSKSYNTGVQ